MKRNFYVHFVYESFEKKCNIHLLIFKNIENKKDFIQFHNYAIIIYRSS